MKPYDYGITLFQLEGTVLPNYSPLFGLSTDDAYNNNLVLYYIHDITRGDAGVLQASNMKFPTNQWVHVEWAQKIKNDGTSSVKVWINGDKLFDYSGHLDYEGRPWYFNIDLYRGNAKQTQQQQCTSTTSKSGLKTLHPFLFLSQNDFSADLALYSKRFTA
jgi:hypothetical protein